MMNLRDSFYSDFLNFISRLEHFFSCVNQTRLWCIALVVACVCVLFFFIEVKEKRQHRIDCCLLFGSCQMIRFSIFIPLIFLSTVNEAEINVVTYFKAWFILVGSLSHSFSSFVSVLYALQTLQANMFVFCSVSCVFGFFSLLLFCFKLVRRTNIGCPFFSWLLNHKINIAHTSFECMVFSFFSAALFSLF